MFTPERTRTIKSNDTNSNSIDNNKLDDTDLKIKKKLTRENHQSVANKKIVDVIRKRHKGLENLRLMEKRQKIRKPENLWFKIDSELNRKCG